MEKKALAVAIAGALSVPMAAQAVDFKVSGHINRAIRFVDFGQGSDVTHVDHSGSRSRVRFVGSEKFGNITAGVNLEIGFASNRSTVSGNKSDGNDSDNGDSFGGAGNDIRHSALWFSGAFGKVTMGHTSESTDGVVHVDLSGTGLVDTPFPNMISAVAFRTSNGGFVTDAGGGIVTGSEAFDSQDGNRIDLLRYDTPALGPFGLNATIANNEHWSAQATLGTALAGGRLEAAIGYEDSDNRAGHSTFGGSASFIFSQGTSITVSGSTRDYVAVGRDSSDFIYAKLGHKWGNNAVSLSYWDTSNQANNDQDGTQWGVAFVHTIPKPGVELYAGYNNFDLDAPAAQTTGGGSVEDIDAGWVGARVRFQ